MIHNLIIFLESSKYILLFLGAFFEGPVFMISGGFLWHIGQFKFFPMYMALVFGDFSADVMWYWVGYIGARPLVFKYGKYLGITPEIIDKVEQEFKKYHEKILIFSKLTMGFGFALAILIFSGIAKISFKKYAAINLIGGFVWVSFLITVGYIFGDVYGLIPASLKYIFILIMLVAVFLLLRKLKIYLAKRKNAIILK
ncbi:MAG TPA: DedA family protein [Candidatus Paceibacterota bacterium]|nr:DedA family protein [Candidatus Paceibacterota bacterium]